jgi:ParB family chromosome partitioning protein
MQFEKREIPLDTIDSSDQTCRVSSFVDPDWIDALARSIERLGLLQAPWIIDRGPHRQIVSGFRRIAACRCLGRVGIVCRSLARETPNRTYVQLAVAENAWQRPLNLMEKARAFALLGKSFHESSCLAEIANSLGLAENPTMIEKLIRLTRLPTAVQIAVETGLLGLAMALRLGTLEAQESKLILELFQAFHLGLNRQRELLELIREIAKRESISISQVLASDDLIAILNRSDQDRSARCVNLRQYLKKRRYPALTETETKFAQLERKLELGPRARMVPPPFFEGKTYQVNLKFDTLKELGAHCQMLEKITRHPDLKAFFNR